MKIKIDFTPFLWKTLRNIALSYGTSMIEAIRLSILLAGVMCDCLPKEGDNQ